MVCTVARYMLEPFMAYTVVARSWMCCQGHIAHGTSRLYHLVSVSTWFTLPRACGSQCVNRIETSTSSWYNPYLYCISKKNYHHALICQAEIKFRCWIQNSQILADTRVHVQCISLAVRYGLTPHITYICMQVWNTMYWPIEWGL